MSGISTLVHTYQNTDGHHSCKCEHGCRCKNRTKKEEDHGWKGHVHEINGTHSEQRLYATKTWYDNAPDVAYLLD